MATNPLQHVLPGDLITADWANGVVDELNSLAAQLAALGSPPQGQPAAGAPVLTGRTPSGDVHVNDQLTLLGKNFSPLSSARINIGGVVVTQFLAGSSDTQLRFSVPNVPPGPVGITVSTPQGTSSNMLSANVLAAVQPQGGQVHIAPANDPQHPPTPQANHPLQLQWTVSSDTLAADTYAFRVDFADVQPPDQTWTATLNTTQQTIQPGTPFTVVATVQVPASGSASVTLTATSTTDATRTRTSDPLPLAVGSTSPTSDPRIALSVVDPQPDFDAHGNPSNATLIRENGRPVILVAKSVDSFVQIQVHFADTTATPPVSYRFFAEVADTTHWTAGAASPATLVQTALGGTTTVLYAFTNAATDASPNDTTLTVKAAKLASDGTTDDYVSFAAVTLRNAG